jgi:hypothetical protein
VDAARRDGWGAARWMGCRPTVADVIRPAQSVGIRTG